MKCNTCKNEDKNQEYEYPASLYLHNGSYYIIAHYGSRYDMQRYILKSGHHKIGEICDDCINKFIIDGTANLIEDGVW